jgi:hypothetical protein
MENLTLLLKRLLEYKIEFILVGGYAAVLHGSSQVTHDVDICALIDEGELQKLKIALKDLEPKHRMNPSFQPSLEEYPKPGQNLDNYYLKTKSGVLDIIKRVDPIGDYEELKKNALTIELFGYPCRVISLDDLIKAKSYMTLVSPIETSYFGRLSKIVQK